jgi:glycosyltransferase involved in cell wall biosynthesis
MPWLTVVVPVYNQAEYLEQCLLSLSQQTSPDWECLVVDDGSTDGTQGLAQTIARRDARFSYVHQQNSGVSAARNQGWRRARGDWVAFLDADDFYFEEAVASFKTCCELTEAGPDRHRILSGGVLTSFAEPTPSPAETPLRVRDLLLRTMHVSRRGRSPLLQNTVFHRTLVDALGGFDADLPTSEDRDFLIRACALSQVALFPKVTAFYRTHHGAGKSDRYLASGEKVHIHRQIFQRLPDCPALAWRRAHHGLPESFDRLRRSYLHMLDAVDSTRSRDLARAAALLQEMAEDTRDDDELRALVGRFTYFFRFPAAQPGLALKNSLRHLWAVSARLDPRQRLGVAVDRQIRRETWRITSSHGRQILSFDHGAAAAAGAEEGERDMPGAEPNGPGTPDSQSLKWISFTVVGTGPVETDGRGCFRVPPLHHTALSGERILLASGRAGPLVVDRDVAEALKACTLFRSFEHHEKLVVARGLLPLARAPALQEALRTLRERGMLVPLRALFPSAGPSSVGRPTTISRLAVIAVHSIETGIQSLRSHLENAVAHQRRPEVLLFDASVRKRDGCPRTLSELARETGVSVRYAGLPEATIYARRLLSECDRDPQLASVLVPAESGTAGAWLNLLLLETVGEPVLTVREASRCTLARLENRDHVLLLNARNGVDRTVRFRDLATLERHLYRADLDHLGLHERYLGRPCRDVLADHVEVDLDGDPSRFMASGGRGEPYVAATVSSLWGSLSGEASRRQLIQAEILDTGSQSDWERYRDSVSGPAGWTGVIETTLGRSLGFRAGATALWNQTGDFPPFLSSLTEVESAFGWMLEAIDDRARVAYLPVAVQVVAGRSGAPTNMDHLLLASLLSHGHPLWTRRPPDRLAHMSQHLASLADLPPSDLIALLRPAMASWVSREMVALERLHREQNAHSSPLAEDTRRYLDALISGIEEPIAPVLVHELQQRLRRFGCLLSAWPDLIHAAVKLREKGIRATVAAQDMPPVARETRP